MNTDYNIFKEYETSTINYYNESVSDCFYSYPIFKLQPSIFFMLVERQFITTPPKLQSESSEKLCEKIYVFKELWIQSSWVCLFPPLQVSMELLAYYSSYRGDNKTTEVNHVYFIRM